jgi:hypothetical protein
MKKLAIILGVFISSISYGITAEEVYAECLNQGIEHPEIVTAQAVEETGWFKCTNCSLGKNNIFGYYYKGAYIDFDTWQESVQYYKRWQLRHYKGNDYYDYLNCLWVKKDGSCTRYASNPEYTNNLRKIVKKYYPKWVIAYKY